MSTLCLPKACVTQCYMIEVDVRKSDDVKVKRTLFVACFSVQLYHQLVDGVRKCQVMKVGVRV